MDLNNFLKWDQLIEYTESFKNWIFNLLQKVHARIGHIEETLYATNTNLSKLDNDLSTFQKEINSSFGTLSDFVIYKSQELEAKIINTSIAIHSDIDWLKTNIDVSLNNLKEKDIELNNKIIDTSILLYNEIQDLKYYVDGSINILKEKDDDLQDQIKILQRLNYIDSYVFYHETNNKASLNIKEVGSETSDILTNYIDYKYANASFGFSLDGSGYTQDWELLNAEFTKTIGVIPFDVNYNVITCTFKFDQPNIKLYDNLGKIGNQQLEYQEYKVNLSLYGYYNIGYMIGEYEDVTFNYDSQCLSKFNDNCVLFYKFKYSDLNNNIGIGTWIQDALKTSSFIYVAIPQNFKISKAYIRNKLSGSTQELPNPFLVNDMVYNVHDFNKLSSINKYNIWCIQKAELNGDNTVTANGEPIKIIINKI